MLTSGAEKIEAIPLLAVKVGTVVARVFERGVLQLCCWECGHHGHFEGEQESTGVRGCGKMKREIDEARASLKLYTHLVHDEIARGAWNPCDDGGVQSCGRGADDTEREGHSVGQEFGMKQALESPYDYGCYRRHHIQQRAPAVPSVHADGVAGRRWVRGVHLASTHRLAHAQR